MTANEREPGWYWVRRRYGDKWGDWRPHEWQAFQRGDGQWLGLNGGKPDEIGLRIMPPDAPTPEASDLERARKALRARHNGVQTLVEIVAAEFVAARREAVSAAWDDAVKALRIRRQAWHPEWDAAADWLAAHKPKEQP